MSSSQHQEKPDNLQLYSENRPLAAEEMKDAAGRGLQGTARSLPHLDRIQHAFGSGHDLSGVRAFVGGQAGQAAGAMQAKAYATGDRVAFKDSPDLRLAAHEAAHIIQQRAGAAPSGGVGQPGDVYERHADKVADRVASGQPVSDLLPQAGEGASAEAIQRYTEEQDTDGATWRVADDEKAAVKETQAEGGQTLYATPDLIEAGNKGLEATATKGSYVRLEERGHTITVGSNTLSQVVPSFHDAAGDGSQNPDMVAANKKGGADSSGDTQDWFKMYADCGRSSRAVMGSQGEAPKALFKVGDTPKESPRAFNPGAWTDDIYLQGMKAFISDPNNDQYLKKGVHYKEKFMSFLRKEENRYKLVLPSSGKEAKKFFAALDEVGQKAFGAYVQINEAVNPEIGEGYTMATGSDIPGYKEVSKMTWNFHWAGVIMKAGGDNVTLENYAIMFPKTGDPVKDAENRKKAYDYTNTDWVFQMYGTVKEGQTFHEQHLKSGTHGTKGTTFRVKI